MTADRALPLTVIVEMLAGDVELVGVVVAELSKVLRPSDHSHVAVLQSLQLLRDRLVSRYRELRATTDAIEADLQLARLGLLP